jgi:linalool 8-monooxygenase
MTGNTIHDETIPPDFLLHKNFDNGHPLELYKQLREVGPVCWGPMTEGCLGAWLITGFAEADEVSRDPTRFCSAQGFQFEDQKFQSFGPQIANAMDALMIKMDPPEHSYFKKLLLPYLSPSSIERSRPYARQILRSMFEDVQEASAINLVDELCAEFPIKILGELMGVPESDRNFLMHRTNLIIGANDSTLNIRPEDATSAFMDVFNYGRELVHYRRKNPSNDMVSAIATAKHNGSYLSEEEVDGFFAFMVAAGNETTRSGIAGGVAALARSVDSLGYLRNHPESLGNAIDEMLRFHSPVIHMRRTATQDTELGGKNIVKGDKVVMLYGAINRDPRVFDNPDHFDVTRPKAKKHLAFGVGVHRCIGAVLAKMEMLEYFDLFVRTFAAVELLEEPRYIRSNFVCSPSRLMVRLRK